ALPDQALMLALLSGGQRMAQLLRARVSDYDEHTATLRLYDPKGKRQTPREHPVPLAPRAAKLAGALLKRAKQNGSTALFDVGGGVLMATETVGVRASEICADMGGEK